MRIVPTLILASIFFVTGLPKAHAEALTIEFDRKLIQGAMVTGHTNALKLRVLNRDVIPDEKGAFVFGLGRDIPAELSVHIAAADGSSVKRIYAVKQRSYVEQRIEGVAQKYVSPPEEVNQRIRREIGAVKKARSQTRHDTMDYAMTYIWPAEGPISGVYGSRRVFNGVPKRPHYGLDIAANTGTPVVAPVDGKVTLVADMYYSGWTLIVDHGKGISSTFIHLNTVHVEEGAEVKQGDHIADIGATGRVTGPHLDWRMNWFEQRLDPQLLLPER